MNHKKPILLPILAALLLALTSTFTASAANIAAVAPEIFFEDAVTAAKDARPGLTMLALSLEDEDGMTLYKAVMLNPADNTLAEVFIDPMSGKVMVGVDTGDDQSEAGDAQVDQVEDADPGMDKNSEENDDEEAALAGESLQSVQVTFEQALSAVKKAYPGLNIVKLGLEDENGVLVFKAELMNRADNSEVEVMIDGKTGQVAPEDDNIEHQDENEDLQDENEAENSN